MRRRKKKYKVKWNMIVVILLMFIFLVMFLISIKNIFSWKMYSDDTETMVNKIDEIVNITDVEDNENTEIIEIKEEIPKFNPYWDYIKMNLINVDFSELKKVNPDTLGWIQVNGTNVNYPFVKYSDNDYYLTHSFDKSYNEAGWVFMDYRNNTSNMDRNTIIYAHGRFDKTMFGSLRTILSNGWLNDSNNFVIKLSSEYENTLWQVFSVYRIPTTSDYLRVNFDDNTDFLDFGKMLLDRSNYDFKTSIDEFDKILTLSTCYNNDDKIVIHAKLIKKEDRN